MPLPSPIDLLNWPVLSQDISRSNALREAVACATRRREREDVDEFLDQHRSPVPRQRLVDVREPRRA